jgi:membrane protein YdbS with pleckstrin-like domain
VIEFLSRPLLRFLRVPAEPRLPAGEPGSARVFRASPHYWTLRLLGWSTQQAFTLAGFLFLMAILHAPGHPWTRHLPIPGRGELPPILLTTSLSVIQFFETIAISLWLVQLPVTFALMRLDYEMRWYIVTDRAARLREGIVNLREMTFTLANVQDIRIQQGPLQRLFGLADVELRTAGGSDGPAEHAGQAAAAAHNLHLARFRGVDNAAAIRDLVVDRMRKARDAGLGDPDDAARPAPAPALVPTRGTRGLEAAARELAAESARLRAVVSGRPGV